MLVKTGAANHRIDEALVAQDEHFPRRWLACAGACDESGIVFVGEGHRNGRGDFWRVSSDVSARPIATLSAVERICVLPQRQSERSERALAPGPAF